MITFAVCHCCFSRPGKKWPTIFIDLLYLSHFPRNPITTHGNLSTLEKIKKIAKIAKFL